SSTVGGSGTVGAIGTTGAPLTGPSRDFPSASTVPSDSSPPSVSSPESDSPPPSAPASGPSSKPAPSVCAKQSDCKLIKSWNVGGGYLVAAFSAPSASSGIGAAVLMLARDEVPVYWHVFDGASPSELLCKVAGGTVRNCVLVDQVG